MMNKKFTFKSYALLFLYFTGCFFLLGLAIRIFIGFMHLREFYLPADSVIKNLKMSLVAGCSITLGAFVFNKIDEYNVRKNKKDPTDPPDNP